MPQAPAAATSSPWRMSLADWKAVAGRTWAEAGDDNIGLVAAGVAFYGFLALVPMLGAVVLSYGLIAEPATVIRNVQGLAGMMPADAAKLIGEQLMNVVQTSGGKKGLGLLLALGVALFGARNAAGAIVTALNIAYEEKETRGFVRLNLLALAITVAGVCVAIVAMVAVAALSALETLLPGAPGIVVAGGKLLSYLLLGLAAAAGAATLYRYGPARQRARWIWLTPGSALAAVGWLVLTLGFGIYVANFGNYNATYGSLGAVVALLTWLYLSSYILMFGAELNAELEHQTTRDTTTGPERAIGRRGAWVADHVAGQGKAAVPPVAAAPPAPPTREDVVTDAALALGATKADLTAAAIASLGLTVVGRPGRAREGALLLTAAGLVAWFGAAVIAPRPKEKGQRIG